MIGPYILQVVGYSKSGKTTLIEELIALLMMSNITAITLKSARSHSYVYSTKDSDKFLKSGAKASAVLFNNLTQISFARKQDADSTIEAILKLTDCDLVLIEGFNELSYPKILVLGEEIPDSSVLDYKTIKYLYSLEEMEFVRHKSIDELIKQDKVILMKNIEELTSRIIQDLESR